MNDNKLAENQRSAEEPTDDADNVEEGNNIVEEAVAAVVAKLANENQEEATGEYYL